MSSFSEGGSNVILLPSFVNFISIPILFPLSGSIYSLGLIFGYKLLPFYYTDFFPFVFSSSLSSHSGRPKDSPVPFPAALQHHPL
jgi:hypothetical protein